MSFPRFIIAGTGSGVGKTTITLGIMAALRKKGYQVAPYKVGPDYIDPGFHTYVTGSKSRNLDLWLLTEETILYLVQKNSLNADVSVIEGVMGLYDGRGTNTEISTAHLAKVLKAPVILVLDGRGMAASAAATVLGYKLYDPDVNLCGVIINQVGSVSHYQLLKEAIERDTGVQCFGYLSKNEQIHLKSRHLGLIPGIEEEELQNKVNEVVNQIEQSIDLAGLMQLAQTAPDLQAPRAMTEIEHIKKCLASQRAQVGEFMKCKTLKIGVAYDRAFHFYYQDSLDLLEELGVELVQFSPLAENSIPEGLDGLYIGGGFPEIFAEQLQENIGMRQSIAAAILSGVPTYAECGGLMYLSKEIVTIDGKSYQMVGAIPSRSVMTKKLQRFGYVEVLQGENIFKLTGTKIPAHEFHYSILEETEQIEYTYEIFKKNKSWNCGVKVNNLLAGYPHLHFYSNPQLAYGFLQKCLEYHMVCPQKIF